VFDPTHIVSKGIQW